MTNDMKLLGSAAVTLTDVLPRLGRTFPGFSADEADAFALGFWAGAMALALKEQSDSLSASEIAKRVDAEFARIEADDDDRGT